MPILIDNPTTGVEGSVIMSINMKKYKMIYAVRLHLRYAND